MKYRVTLEAVGSNKAKGVGAGSQMTLEADSEDDAKQKALEFHEAHKTEGDTVEYQATEVVAVK